MREMQSVLHPKHEEDWRNAIAGGKGGSTAQAGHRHSTSGPVSISPSSPGSPYATDSGLSTCWRFLLMFAFDLPLQIAGNISLLHPYSAHLYTDPVPSLATCGTGLLVC
jgi:hypothetical protein